MGVKRPLGHRQRQAEATKQEIARAARAVFAERGYVGTTIRAISEAADIPVPTIYSAFGNKAAILAKITQDWMVEAQTADLARASLAEPAPARQLRLLAELNRRQLDVGSDVIAIYQEAARSDPAMLEVKRTILAAREREIRKLVTAVAPGLRSDLPVERALDITLALTVPEVYQTLVVERGWSGDRYETWLGAVLVDELLGGGAAEPD